MAKATEVRPPNPPAAPRIKRPVDPGFRAMRTALAAVESTDDIAALYFVQGKLAERLRALETTRDRMQAEERLADMGRYAQRTAEIQGGLPRAPDPAPATDPR